MAPDAANGAIRELRGRIDARLAELLPAETLPPQNLGRAIRYAALAPGKRLRGLLTLLAAGPGAPALDAACAMEMVHAASLVIDDMPFMDDAVMRRGQPALHRVYGEDTATLAALALLSQAYAVIAADAALPAQLRAELAVLLHQALGPQGLVGGQELDLHGEYPAEDMAGVSDMYERKTGVLFIAAAEMGGLIAGLDAAGLGALRRFARAAGLAYQVADDLADIGTAADEVDADESNIVSTVGRAEAEQLLAGLLGEARGALGELGAHGQPLAELMGCMFDGRGAGAADGDRRTASA